MSFKVPSTSNFDSDSDPQSAPAEDTNVHSTHPKGKKSKKLKKAYSTAGAFNVKKITSQAPKKIKSSKSTAKDVASLATTTKWWKMFTAKAKDDSSSESQAESHVTDTRPVGQPPGSPTLSERVAKFKSEFNVELSYLERILVQSWNESNRANFLSQLDQCATLVGERIDNYTSLVHAGVKPGVVIANRKALADAHARLKVVHQDLLEWLGNVPRTGGIVVETSDGKRLMDCIKEAAEDFFDEVESTSLDKTRFSKKQDSSSNSTHSILTEEDRALIAEIKRLDSLSPPPKPPLPLDVNPLANYMASLPAIDPSPEPVPPKIYETLDSVVGPLPSDANCHADENAVWLSPHTTEHTEKPRSMTLPTEMHGFNSSQYVEKALDIHDQFAAMNGINVSINPSTVCSPLNLSLNKSANVDISPGGIISTNRRPLPAPPIDDRASIIHSPAKKDDRCGDSKVQKRSSTVANPGDLHQGRDSRQASSRHTSLVHSANEDPISSACSESSLHSDEENKSEVDDFQLLQKGPIHRSEVKSDTENSEEIIVVDGKKFVQRYKKHILIEKFLIKQVILAPAKPDGSGPDIDLDALDFTPHLPIGSDSHMAQQAGNTDDSPINEDTKLYATLANGSTDRSVGGRCRSLTSSPEPILREPQKPPPPKLGNDPLNNYMFRFGKSQYTEPVLDKRLSSLFDFFRSQWHKSENSESPQERSKTISYVQRYTQQTPTGEVVHRSIGVKQTRRIRMHPGGDLDLTLKSHSACNDEAEDKSESEKEPQSSGVMVSSKIHIVSNLPANYRDSSSKESTVHPSSSSNINNNVALPLDPTPKMDFDIYGSIKSPQPEECCYVDPSSLWSPILEKIDAAAYLQFTDQSSEFSSSGSSAPEISVKAGCVDALIVYATQIGKVSPDYYLFFETFLVTYRTFMTSEELVDKLIARYHYFQRAKHNQLSLTHGGESALVTDAEKEKVCSATASFLTNVVSQLKRDMTPKMHERLLQFVEQLKSAGEDRLAVVFSSILDKQLALRKKHVESMNSMELPLSERVVTAKSQTLLDFSSKAIAEQMTVIEANMFDKIEIPELLDIKAIEMEKNARLSACCYHFNTVTNWAKTLILSDDRKSNSERERYMQKFLDIMEHLHELRNFGSYLALQCSLIAIPECIYSKKMKSKLERVKNYMKPPGFLQYRKEIDEAPLPCIPYMGLIFQHLIQLNACNKQFLPPHPAYPNLGPMVNFWRCWKHFLIINFFVKKERMDQEKSRYQLPPNPEVLAFLNNFHDHLSDSSLDALAAKLVQEFKAAKKD